MNSYNKICVKFEDNLTESKFSAHIGVRYGDVLSPNIFKICINDFSHIMEENSKLEYVSLGEKKKNITDKCR